MASLSPSRPPGRPRQERCKHGHSIAVWAYYRPDGGRQCAACKQWRSAGLPAQPGYHGYAEAAAICAAAAA